MRMACLGFACTLCLVAPACDPPDACDDIAPSELALVPILLSQTGLYADIGSELVADGVLPFAPAFPLWSDGADKRRYVFLPPGQVIDSSRMDSWGFPEGTKLWKELTRDGVRIETRLLQKVGPDGADWVAV